MQEKNDFDEYIEKNNILKWLYKFSYQFVISIFIISTLMTSFSTIEVNNYINNILPELLNRIIIFIVVAIFVSIVAYRFFIPTKISLVFVSFFKTLALDVLNVAFSTSVFVVGLVTVISFLYPSNNIDYLEWFLFISTLSLFIFVPLLASVILEKNNIGKKIFGVKKEKK